MLNVNSNSNNVHSNNSVDPTVQNQLNNVTDNPQFMSLLGTATRLTKQGQNHEKYVKLMEKKRKGV